MDDSTVVALQQELAQLRADLEAALNKPGALSRLITATAALDWRDVLVRAGKTFVQAAIAALYLPTTGLCDVVAWKSIVMAAVAAGVSAAWNVIREALALRKTKRTE